MLDVARTFPATNQRCQQPTGAGKMIFPAPVFYDFCIRKRLRYFVEKKQ